MRVALTPEEWRALKHRIEEPASIADNFYLELQLYELEEHAGDWRGALTQVLEKVVAGWDGKYLDLEGADAIDEVMTDDILRNCVECPTFLSRDCGESDEVIAAGRRILESLAEKIERARGMEPLAVPDG